MILYNLIGSQISEEWRSGFYLRMSWKDRENNQYICTCTEFQINFQQKVYSFTDFQISADFSSK